MQSKLRSVILFTCPHLIGTEPAGGSPSEFGLIKTQILGIELIEDIRHSLIR